MAGNKTTNLGLPLPKGSDPITPLPYADAMEIIDDAHGGILTDLQNVVASVSGTNVRIDDVEAHVDANTANTKIQTVTDKFSANVSGIESIAARRVGPIVLLSFTYKPDTIGFNAGIITTTLPASMPMGVWTGSRQSRTDVDIGVSGYIVTNSISLAVKALPSYQMFFSCVYVTSAA